MTESLTSEDISINEELFGGNDFVFTQKEDGTIIGGGYKINSMFLQGGIPIMSTYNHDNDKLNNEKLNKEKQEGGKVSSPFENLAVPAGLFYVNMKFPKKNKDNLLDDHFKGHNTISDDMMDKLYSMVEADKKRKRKTRKTNLKVFKSKTRRLK